MSIKQKLWYKLYIKIKFRFYTKSNIKIKTIFFFVKFPSFFKYILFQDSLNQIIKYQW